MDGRSAAAPYSTGGGGVRLEQAYGATLLASLLTGDPLSELGDDASPTSVRFQAPESPVDDFLVTGETPDGGQRRVSIGARRNPGFTGGDAKTRALLTGYVDIVTGHWDEVRAGRWRLALVTGSRGSKAPAEVGELAEIARTRPGNRDFRDEVARRSQPLQKRLAHVDTLVTAIARTTGGGGSSPGELSWRLLSCLSVQETRLEGTSRKDRTDAVSRLRNVVQNEANATADALFDKLYDLSSGYDQASGDITREMLIRDLSGFPLVGSQAARPGSSSPESPAVVVLAPPGRDQAPGTVGLPAPPDRAGEPWKAGQEFRAGGRRYLLCEDTDGLLRDVPAVSPASGGQVIWRQALARQTDPPPASGRRYAWLRQGGQELRHERDLADRVLSGRVLPDRPLSCQAARRAGARPNSVTPAPVTLALSWPEDRRSGLPCPTARAWFTPGALDPWRLSILLRGLSDLMTSLEQLHRLGKAHRALALEAVIVTGDGSFVLRDLGLAAVGYQPGEGPDDYRSPEQRFGARGARPGPATDVYQAAAVAYHLITGRLRVPGIPPPPVRQPDVPAAASAVIDAALADRPENRPGSREFRAALRR